MNRYARIKITSCSGADTRTQWPSYIVKVGENINYDSIDFSGNNKLWPECTYTAEVKIGKPSSEEPESAWFDTEGNVIHTESKEISTKGDYPITIEPDGSFPSVKSPGSTYEENTLYLKLTNNEISHAEVTIDGEEVSSFDQAMNISYSESDNHYIGIREGFEKDSISINPISEIDARQGISTISSYNFKSGTFFYNGEDPIKDAICFETPLKYNIDYTEEDTENFNHITSTFGQEFNDYSPLFGEECNRHITIFDNDNFTDDWKNITGTTKDWSNEDKNYRKNIFNRYAENKLLGTIATDTYSLNSCKIVPYTVNSVDISPITVSIPSGARKVDIDETINIDDTVEDIEIGLDLENSGHIVSQANKESVMPLYLGDTYRQPQIEWPKDSSDNTPITYSISDSILNVKIGFSSDLRPNEHPFKVYTHENRPLLSLTNNLICPSFTDENIDSLRTVTDDYNDGECFPYNRNVIVELLKGDNSENEDNREVVKLVSANIMQDEVLNSEDSDDADELKNNRLSSYTSETDEEISEANNLFNHGLVNICKLASKNSFDIAKLNPDTHYWLRCTAANRVKTNVKELDLGVYTQYVMPSIALSFTPISGTNSIKLSTSYTQGSFGTEKIYIVYNAQSNSESYSIGERRSWLTNDDIKVVSGSSVQASEQIVTLNPGETYYAQAYVVEGNEGNLHVRAKSTVVPYSLNPSKPSVSTEDATDIDLDSATLNGNLDNTGNANCNVYFGYSTDVDVITAWDGTGTAAGITVTSPIPQSGIGAFSDHVDNLSYSTQYYYKAVASNTSGISTGDVKSFKTKKIYIDNLEGNLTSIRGTITTQQ